jgi:hypothetical protein
MVYRLRSHSRDGAAEEHWPIIASISGEIFTGRLGSIFIKASIASR